MNDAASAIAKLRAAGFIVDDDRAGYPVVMRKVRRSNEDVHQFWLDTGDTVGVLGDASDKDDVLYLDVIEALDGAEARHGRKGREIHDVVQAEPTCLNQR